MARECAREARCLRKLGALRVQRQELQARRKKVQLVEKDAKDKAERESKEESQRDEEESQREASPGLKSPSERSVPRSPSRGLSEGSVSERRTSRLTKGRVLAAKQLATRKVRIARGERDASPA